VKLPEILCKKTFLLVTGIILVLAMFLSPKANAFTSMEPPTAPLQEQRSDYKLDIWEKAVYQESGMNLESFINESFKSILASGIDLIAGPSEGATTSPQSQGGAVGTLANIIGTIYSYPPASSTEYLAYLKESIGITPPVYAQTTMGIGFAGLNQIINLWKAFRNMAYLFFVVIFIIIGFAIMFRIKIDPQTVISIQNALPKIIIALILVTFSYAIAGFLIDLLYVSINIPLVAFVRSGVISQTDAQGFFNKYAQADLLDALGFVISLGGRGIGQLISQLGAPGVAGMGVMAIIGLVITNVVGAAAIAGFAIPVVIGLALSLLLFLFRILFMLIKAYVMTLLLIILGPIIILLEVLPGQSGFSRWLTGLISNLSVFVVAIYLFIFVDIIDKTLNTSQPIWGPPLIGGGVNTIKMAVSFGVIMIIPNVAELVQSLIAGKGGPMIAADRSVAALGEQIGGLSKQIGSEVLARART